MVTRRPNAKQLIPHDELDFVATRTAQYESHFDGPDFLIIGAMKSGTTSLAELLSSSPTVEFPAGKEPDVLHLVGDEFDQRIDDYRASFRLACAEKVLGDASPSLTFFADDSAAVKAKSVGVPGLRLVYVVRNPLDRAVSHYNHALRVGWRMDANIDAALASEKILVQASSYWSQLSKWRREFGDTAIRVVRFEDLVANKDVSEGVIDSLEAHLGIKLPTNANMPHTNSKQDRVISRAGFSTINKIGRAVKSWLPQTGVINELESLAKVVVRSKPPSSERPSLASALKYLDMLRAEMNELGRFMGLGGSPWNLDENAERVCKRGPVK